MAQRITVTVTKRQLDWILAELRTMQREGVDNELVYRIATEHGEYPTERQIDRMCEQLNLAKA